MMRRLALFLLAAVPALAGFQKTLQPVKLQYGQKSTTVVFRTDGVAVKRAKAHCDCTEVTLRGNELHAVVDTSLFDAPVDKTIDATTADGKTTRLTMRFDVPPAIILSARSLIWKRGSACTPQEIRITLPKGSPVTDVVDAGLNGKAFDYRPRTIKKGSTYAITITPLSTDKALLNRLVIKTQSSDPRFSQLIVYLQIRK